MRVLLVDDNPHVRAGARIMFGRDYDLVILEDGESALELLERQEFDVIVCDREMPVMGGEEVWSRLPLELRAKFLLWTGAPHGVRAGIRVLKKPVSVEELREVVVEIARG